MDRQTDNQRDRQTERQTDRQTDRQKNRQTKVQKNRLNDMDIQRWKDRWTGFTNIQQFWYPIISIGYHLISSRIPL